MLFTQNSSLFCSEYMHLLFRKHDPNLVTDVSAIIMKQALQLSLGEEVFPSNILHFKNFVFFTKFRYNISL